MKFDPCVFFSAVLIEHFFFGWPRNVGNEGPSIFTLVYWVFIPSFPTKGQLVFEKEAWRLHNFDGFALQI